MAVIGVSFFESVFADHSKDHPVAVSTSVGTHSPGLLVHHFAGLHSLETVPAECLVPAEAQPDYSGGDFVGPIDEGVAERILTSAGSRAHAAIVHHETGDRFSYPDLDRLSARLARHLVRLGVRPGDRVALRGGNRPEQIIAALAVWRAAGIVVPIPFQARAEELAFFFEDVAARFLVTEDVSEDVAQALEGADVGVVIVYGDSGPVTDGLRWDDLMSSPVADELPLPAVDPDAVAIIWHTGGTTGRPKACYHTHRRFLLAGYSLGIATGSGPGQKWAAAAPVGHALGFIFHTIYTLLHGATIVLVERFHNPEALLEAIRTHRLDTVAAITATWAGLKALVEKRPELAPDHSFRAYAMWQSASAGDVYDWWKARGVELLNNFGSTSFATWVLIPDESQPVPRASLGRAAPEYDVIAVDPDGTSMVPLPPGTPGRMAVRGPSGLTYWNRPDLQQRDVRDGWTLVDDLICITEDGSVAYLGRTDFLISTAGYKVAPGEVEAVLGVHPAVREVAVLGTPDPVRSQVVSAFIALNEGFVPGDDLRRDIQGWVKERLSPYKYPRIIEFIDALPRDSVGKVIHRILRDADVGSTIGRTSAESPAPKPLKGAQR